MTYIFPSSHAMEFNLSLMIVVTLGIGTSMFMILAFFLSVKQDPREPPYIPQTIPWVGHLIQVIRKGTRYYDRVRYCFFEMYFYDSR